MQKQAEWGPAAWRSAYERCAPFPALRERRTGAAPTWTPRASAAVGVARRMGVVREISLSAFPITNYHAGCIPSNLGAEGVGGTRRWSEMEASREETGRRSGEL